MLKHLRILLFIGAMTAFYACKQHIEQIPITDFFKASEKTVFRISPDGKYISYLKSYKDRNNLFIQSLADGNEKMVTSFTDYSVRGDYFWTYNNRIMFIRDIIAADEYEMSVVDVSTLAVRPILYKEKARIFLVSRNKGEPDIINIRMNKRDPANFDIYRLNILTGQLTPYLTNPGNITEWFPDPDGKIRLVNASDGVDQTILYRPNDKTPFKPVIENNFKTLVKPIAFTGDKNYFYALSNINRDKTALVEINAEDGKEKKVIYACDNADLQDYSYSKNRHKLEMVSWDAAKPMKHFLSPGIEDM
jgi:Tol biopolymer transport system component